MRRLYASRGDAAPATTMGDAARASGLLGRLESRLDWTHGRALRFTARARESMRRLPVFLVVLFVATAVWILLWAGYDLVILTGAFPATPGYHPNMDLYLEATWWVLFPLTSFLAFRRHAWLPILALAVGGWEDILFYWIQGHAVPATLAYLPQTPTADLLYLRAEVFLAAAIPGAVVARLPRTRIRFVPLELIMLLTAVFVNFWVFVAAIPAYAGVKQMWMRRRSRALAGRPPSPPGPPARIE